MYHLNFRLAVKIAKVMEETVIVVSYFEFEIATAANVKLYYFWEIWKWFEIKIFNLIIIS